MGIFLDLTKAFDLIDHNNLLLKLERYGIRGTPLKLLKSYLSDRKQYVTISNVNSSQSPITLGVPQGSILGPFLFLTYINDLTEHLHPFATSVLYADDTNIFVQARFVDSLFAQANAVLAKCTSWLFFNKLVPNINKSTFVIFHPYQKSMDSSSFQLLLSQKPLSRSPSAKFLGVILDEHLLWHEHVTLIRKKVSSGLYALAKLKHIFPIQILVTVYYALVASHISYAIDSYGLTYLSTIRPLYVLQKKLYAFVCHCLGTKV